MAEQMVFRAPRSTLLRSGVACILFGGLLVYSIGAATDRYQGRVCYQSCPAGEASWLWVVIAAFSMLVLLRLIAVTWRLAVERTELDAGGVMTTTFRSGETRVGWDSIERLEMVGIPNFPVQLHAATTDGRLIRLRGVTLAGGRVQGLHADAFASEIERFAGRHIPVERPDATMPPN
ncbi:MAG: hypothetical protein AAGC53_00610 [Actinomycetota bacterium]